VQEEREAIACRLNIATHNLYQLPLGANKGLGELGVLAAIAAAQGKKSDKYCCGEK